MENLVASALRRKYGENLYDLKDRSKPTDVDFYVPQEKLSIQVCCALDEFNQQREIAGLLRAKKARPQTKLLIVTCEKDNRLS